MDWRALWPGFLPLIFRVSFGALGAFSLLRSARFALRCIVGFAIAFKMSHHKNKGVASHNSLHGKPNAAPRREGAFGAEMLNSRALTSLSARRLPFHGRFQALTRQMKRLFALHFSKHFAAKRFYTKKARALTLA
jgi:hypothetical protein